MVEDAAEPVTQATFLREKTQRTKDDQLTANVHGIGSSATMLYVRLRKHGLEREENVES